MKIPQINLIIYTDRNVKEIRGGGKVKEVKFKPLTTVSIENVKLNYNAEAVLLYVTGEVARTGDGKGKLLLAWR